MDDKDDAVVEMKKNFMNQLMKMKKNKMKMEIKYDKSKINT